MNTNRVTLTAFGTTGVLLAASLTMLAIVSALVTFDAWPTRDRGASSAQIAIQNPHATRALHKLRRASARTGSGGAASAGAGSAGGARAARVPSGSPGGDGGGNPGNPDGNPSPPSDPTPPPQVGPQPPGENPNVPDGGPSVEPASTPPVVDEVTVTACDTISGVGAGAVVGSC